MIFFRPRSIVMFQKRGLKTKRKKLIICNEIPLFERQENVIFFGPWRIGIFQKRVLIKEKE